MSVTECSRGHVHGRHALFNEGRWGRRLGGFRESIRDLDRCVHLESAVDCVPGPNIRYIRFGDIGIVEENAKGSR